ncbi:DegT/DnrJ/EryC1/StrS family aminotransferase [Paucibacter sp. JuS9]|uniref:DegT/DnrJ/EryC1/StrS family aminotransferase n=1 Tax=Paucibacter sp. JuS9 TaxID=3228748 RepID=UPI003757AE14
MPATQLHPAAHPSPTLSALFLPRPNADSQRLLEAPQLELTYSGRGALYTAFREIARSGKTEVLLPGYHCPSCVTPALEAGLKPIFYRVRRDLQIDQADLLAKVTAGTAALLVIHYFGLPTDLGPFQALRQAGVALVEDWSHSFMQGDPPRLAGGGSDYRIYSFWKIAPTGVGGGLWRERGATASPALGQAPLRERVVRFKRLFEEAIKASEHRRLRQLFQSLEQWRVGIKGVPPASQQEGSNDVPRQVAGEDHYPFDPQLVRSGMPTSTRRMLVAQDLATIARRRRTNYQTYAALLPATSPVRPLAPNLPEGACPWVFPVLLERRSERDHVWRSRGVALHTFGIYLHSALAEQADAATLADARYLAEHCLCLAVHQDLSSEQIAASASILCEDLAAPAASLSAVAQS